MVLCGNKCDLPESERAVSKEEGREMAERFKSIHYETSAKLCMNVTEVSE